MSLLVGRTTTKALIVPRALPYATISKAFPSTKKAATTSSKSETAQDPDGPLRPHLNIPVSPNHGLWAFFRKFTPKEEGESTKYVTVEPSHERDDKSGRAWTAPELRRKSFRDLHTLWYLLVRERNLLSTQEQECLRLGLPTRLSSMRFKQVRCRKSMARIKFVLNERRLAFAEAVKIAAVKENLPETASVDGETIALEAVQDTQKA